jgi:hypothetical protein
MVVIDDLKKSSDGNIKKCTISLIDDNYCHFSLSGISIFDFLDIINYKSWKLKTVQKTVNIRYVFIVKKLEKGNTTVRTSVGFAPLLLIYLKKNGFQIEKENIEYFTCKIQQSALAEICLIDGGQNQKNK